MLLAVLLCSNVVAAMETPHLAKHGAATQLIVDGKPYLILGGELGNSAASTLESMEPIWPRLVKLNLNTVLVPAYWDLIEPREGQFDFALVDGIIEGARRHNLRLVFLWFGSWKNSMSCYAPQWIKTDQERFPRAARQDGQSVEILSPFSDANAAADAHAFAAFMQRLRQVDGDRGTVLMVQVENEVGMIPDARDWSDQATTLFHRPVPQELMDYLAKKSPS
jgi:beta-galactosidase GanA